ncbi:MAG: FkbM family methyltransferase [Gemmatimonadota bacterium]
MGGLGDEIRKKLTKKVAFPLLNRLIGDRGDHLYHYSAEMDRLFPIRTFDWRTYRFLSTGELDSDRWWRSLCDLELRGGIIFDVGANTGYTAAWFSTLADRVYAFEPDPTNLEILREQIRIRGLTNVDVLATAVGETVGYARLHRKERGGHHALSDVGASPTMDTIEVPCTTVDTVMSSEGIESVALLKVDVEGFEPEVLRGAAAGLSSGAIQRVVFEYSPEFYRRRDVDERGVTTFLQKLGFDLRLPDGTRFAADGARTEEQCDLLAFAPGVQPTGIG